ncbi:ABC transporter permease [Desulfocurvibacter africanus]|uniref:ABC transporter permease n=1 Tax=Desulfocurvibacter africanus TaxID=873 RepID=UPI001FCBC98E|nr:ABC transporter permease [Desulfocurvibacter africanus]
MMRSGKQSTPPAEVRLSDEPGGARLVLQGRLDSHGVAAVWSESLRLVGTLAGRSIVADTANVDYLDGSGASLILRLELAARDAGGKLEVRGLAGEPAKLLDLYRREMPTRPLNNVVPEQHSFVNEVGRRTALTARNFANFLTFVGQCTAALAAAARNPRLVRWKDVLAVAEEAGVNGLPIVALIGVLMGLVMAFQSAVPMKRFGAELFVADLLGLAMFRELGTLTTAILLAGRSGSAFAAEIGTMKVNEEINALATMGISPVQFLAIPRIIAALVVTPILTTFFNLFALAGGSFVVMGFGYPFITYVNRILYMVTWLDIAGGLIKAAAFSIIVAAVGCQKGLTTGTGASAVGSSTTSAVVTGLVLIAVADGLFAVVFFALGV